MNKLVAAIVAIGLAVSFTASRLSHRIYPQQRQSLRVQRRAGFGMPRQKSVIPKCSLPSKSESRPIAGASS
jgi:hypothetical protein